MASKESTRLITELKDWADKKFGRRSELARMLGLSPQLVSDWFAGRKTPTLERRAPASGIPEKAAEVVSCPQFITV
jgi:hypothetical protein